MTPPVLQVISCNCVSVQPGLNAIDGESVFELLLDTAFNHKLVECQAHADFIVCTSLVILSSCKRTRIWKFERIFQ